MPGEILVQLEDGDCCEQLPTIIIAWVDETILFIRPKVLVRSHEIELLEGREAGFDLRNSHIRPDAEIAIGRAVWRSLHRDERIVELVDQALAEFRPLGVETVPSFIVAGIRIVARHEIVACFHIRLHGQVVERVRAVTESGPSTTVDATFARRVRAGEDKTARILDLTPLITTFTDKRQIAVKEFGHRPRAEHQRLKFRIYERTRVRKRRICGSTRHTEWKVLIGAVLVAIQQIRLEVNRCEKICFGVNTPQILVVREVLFILLYFGVQQVDCSLFAGLNGGFERVKGDGHRANV